MTQRTRVKDRGPGHRRAVPKINPFVSDGAHPEWVQRDHPQYATSHHPAEGAVSSTRTLDVAGHRVAIRTTYEVFLDGRGLPFHMIVDSDGRLWSHLCPYETFATAPELVEYILTHVPEALIGLTPEGSMSCDPLPGHDHGGHR